MKRLTEEQLTKDGEIQVLRQNLNKVKSEASRSHQERLQTEEQRRLQSSLIEKDLKQEVQMFKKNYAPIQQYVFFSQIV